jgi:hypothetical protein
MESCFGSATPSLDPEERESILGAGQQIPTAFE